VLAPRLGERAVDLYAGVGLFAGALAGRLGPTGTVTAVESDPRATADARRNLHDTPWVRIVEGRVDRLIRGDVGPADLVVLDPPRAGAGRTVVDAVTALGRGPSPMSPATPPRSPATSPSWPSAGTSCAACAPSTSSR